MAALRHEQLLHAKESQLLARPGLFGVYQLLLSQGCHAGQLLALCVFKQNTAADAAHSLTEIHSPYGYGRVVAADK